MRLLSFLLFIVILSQTHAQVIDVSPAPLGSAINLGMAMTQPTLLGTARFVGTGGVMGSVGGDISNLSTNPAGLGMFSKTEISITPNLQINNVNTNYQYFSNSGGINGLSSDRNYPVFSLNNIGVVIANRISEKNPLRASNVTIGVNRIANFNRNVDFGIGANTVYSYSNYLADLASGYTLDGRFVSYGSTPQSGNYYTFDNNINRALMALQTELIGVKAGSSFEYLDPVRRNGTGNVVQNFSRKIKGGIDEASIAWSGNFNDRIYIGVSIGVPFLSYSTDLQIQEDNQGATLDPNYRYFDLRENDNYSGTGVNLKVGGLFKVNDQMKVSAFIHSPTYYEVRNTYSIAMTTNYANSNNTNSIEMEEFKFNYLSPFKAGGGLSYVFGKSGFIGAEYEFTNVMNTSIDVEQSSAVTSGINRVLQDEQINTHTLRVGGEYAKDMFRLRAGYSIRTSPVNPTYVVRGGDQIIHAYSVGAGIRGKSVSFDIAYQRQQYRDYQSVYGRSDIGSFGISTWNTQNNMMATVNFRIR